MASAQARSPQASLTEFRSEQEARDDLATLQGTIPPSRMFSFPRPSDVLQRPTLSCSDTIKTSRFRRATADQARVTGAGAVVTGWVANEKGQPLRDARVTIDRFGLADTTAWDGSYRMEIAGTRMGGNQMFVLRVRGLGYIPRVVAVSAMPGDSIIANLPFCLESNSHDTAEWHAAATATHAVLTTDDVPAGYEPDGGLVRAHGDHLVILRRGRLFTVAVDREGLRAIHAIDVLPGVDTTQSVTDYTDMRIDRDVVTVIGERAGRLGTEINAFRIDRGGGLHHLSSHLLQANAIRPSPFRSARLVGAQVVLYDAAELSREGDPLVALPTLLRWDAVAGRWAFMGGAGGAVPKRVYRAAPGLEAAGGLAVHVVTSCDLASEQFRCASQAIVAPIASAPNLQPTAVYLWAGALATNDGVRATLYRMPLDGSAPTAIRVRGTPLGHHSIREAGGLLEAVVEDHFIRGATRSEGWSDFAPALLRLPVQQLGDGGAAAADDAYRVLPEAGAGWLHARFIGHHLLYGISEPDEPGTGAALMIVPVEGGSPARLALAHGIERIEPMGRDALILGTDDNALHLSGVRLDGELPTVRHHVIERGTSELEEDSTGLDYRDDGQGGIIGLPVRIGDPPSPPVYRNRGAAVFLLRDSGASFQALGAIHDSQVGACPSACWEWSGNRPVFFRGRILALVGFALVEVAVTPSGLSELRRVDIRRDRAEQR